MEYRRIWMILVCLWSLSVTAQQVSGDARWISLADAHALRNPNLLVFQFGAFDPTQGLPDFSREGFPNESCGAYGVVQFHGNPQDRISDFAEMGVDVVGYLPHHAFVVKWTPVGREALERDPELRWTGDYQPAWKVSPSLWPGRAFEEVGSVRVIGFRGTDIQAVTAHLRKDFPDITVEYVDAGAPQPLTRVGVPRDALESFVLTVSQYEAVGWMEPAIPDELHNSGSVSAIQAANTTSQPMWDHDLMGTGQIVAVCDSGLDRNQCWFTQYHNGVSLNTEITDADHPVPPATGTYFSDRKVVAYWVMPGASEYDDNESCTIFTSTSFHGTHTSGTVAGDRGDVATPSDPFFQPSDEDGMAPNAQLLFQDIGNDDSGCLSGTAAGMQNILAQAFAGDARIHSNSWGSNSQGAYTASDQAADEAIWQLEAMLVCVSSGNSGPTEGSVGSPGNAKNVVTVGRTGHDISTVIASSSSVGPTDDGRIKPDLAAPGSSIYSASGDDNDDTPSCPSAKSLSGTSMSCPTVAGGVALLRQYFTDGFYPTGQRVVDDSFAPSGALLKAVLLNGTLPIDDFPNFDAGWGKIWLDNGVYFADQTAERRLRVWSLSHDVGIQTGETHTYEVEMAGADEFRATLVWFDPTPTLGAGIQLVNNLDLEVVDPALSTYTGNQFEDGYSIAGVADDRNTVEQVRLNAAAGTYTLLVHGDSVPGNGQPYTDRQGYALAVTYAECSCGVVSAPANVQATAQAGSGIEITFDSVANATGYQVYRADGDCSAAAESFSFVGFTSTTTFSDTRALGGFSYAYKVRAVDGCGEGPWSSCSFATSSGPCDLLPDFDQTTVQVDRHDATPECDLIISWQEGTLNCANASSLAYNIYRSDQWDFTPGPANLLVSGVTETSFVDDTGDGSSTSYYVVRAEDDTTNGTGPNNQGNESFGNLWTKGTAYESMVDGDFTDGAENPNYLILESPWSFSDQRAASGSASYRNAVHQATAYSPNTCAALYTPSLQLQTATSPELSYQAWFDIEVDWDGVVVEVSNDDGATWDDLPPDGGYPGDFSQTGSPPINQCGYLSSHGAFNGTSGGVFVTYTSDLSAYAGQQITIRWRFSSDPGAEMEGFYLDDVMVTQAQKPQPCCFSSAEISAALASWPLDVDVADLVTMLNQACPANP